MKLVALGVWLLMAGFVQAETLILGDPTQGSEAYESTRDLINRVIVHAGYRSQFINLPPARSLTEANVGKIDGDIGRTEEVVKNLDGLIQIPYPLTHEDYYLYVSTQHSCPAKASDIPQLKPVGIVGVQYFTEVYKLSEVGHEALTELTALIPFLDSGRADYTVMSKTSYAILKVASGGTAKRCFEQPLMRHSIYVYLNKKHQDKINRITQAFIDVNGEPETASDDTLLQLLSEPH